MELAKNAKSIPPPHYVKGTLLPALTLNVGIGRSSGGAESSNINVNSSDTDLEKQFTVVISRSKYIGGYTDTTYHKKG